MLYTSRYQNKALNDEDHLLVRTSRGAPRWKVPYTTVNCPMLAPPKAVGMADNVLSFSLDYADHLEEVGVDNIKAEINSLKQAAGKRKIVLLCFCDLNQEHAYCHRRVFATWYEAETGVKVKEL